MGLKTRAAGVIDDATPMPAIVINGEKNPVAAVDLRAQICARLSAPRPAEC